MQRQRSSFAGLTRSREGHRKTIAGRWQGRPVVVAASGPSLDREGVTRAFEAGCPVIAVNTTGLHVPCHVLFAADYAWWQQYHDKRPIHPDAYEPWTTSKLAAREFDLYFVEGRNERGLSEDPEVVHYGYHSGFQALNLAVNSGASRILLSGFDMRFRDGASHWHGDHPSSLRNPRERVLVDMTRVYARALPALKARGVEVVNCTPGSAIQAFRFGSLLEELGL